MDTTWVWGLVLDGVMLIGTLLLGSKRRAGWLIALVTQVLWSIYAIQTRQWGFFPGIIAYTFAAIRGYRLWGKDDKDEHDGTTSIRGDQGEEDPLEPASGHDS